MRSLGTERNHMGDAEKALKEMGEPVPKAGMAVSPFQHDPAEEHHDVLRVGYIFQGTEIKDNLPLAMALIMYADRNRFAVYGYTLVKAVYRDSMMAEVSATWECLAGLSVWQAAKRIHEDEIDILVDLTGRAENNALPILVYKPAPIQICAIQYSHTTG